MDLQRFYHLAYQEPLKASDGEIIKAGFHYLIMDSVYQGEFGSIKCRCLAQIETPFEFHCFFFETSGEPENSLYCIRQDCIRFFNLHILPLFNPFNHIKDGPLSFSQEPQSSQNP